MNLILPKPNFKFLKKEDNLYVFDRVRKKFVLLTPEEYVRQSLVNYLIEYKNYPEKLISIEYTAIKNRKLFRFDIACFNQNLEIILIAECKSPFVKIDYKAMYQISIYNEIHTTKVLVLTNGLKLYVLQKVNEWKILNDIPNYFTLNY